MTLDALDPGADWSFPNVPRTREGYLDEQLMPVGRRWQGGVLIDVTPSVRLPDGRLVPITAVVPRNPAGFVPDRAPEPVMPPGDPDRIEAYDVRTLDDYGQPTGTITVTHNLETGETTLPDPTTEGTTPDEQA